MAVGKISRSTIKEIEISTSSSTKNLLWDTTIKGFGAYRTSKGVVSFIFQYRMPGCSTQSTKLGNEGELTVEQARGMAADLAFQRRQGINPILERERLRQLEQDKKDLLMAVYAEDYIQRRIDEDAPLDKANLTAIRRDIIGILGHIRIDQMKVDDVEAFAKQLAARGPSTKRTGLIYLKAILNDAIARDRILKSPARSVKTPKSGERIRRLREDEMQRYMEASSEVGGPRGDLLELYARLAKRKDEEIGQMTWEQLDLARNEWLIPDTKNGDPYVVELPRQVREIILRQQPDQRLRQGYVFTLNGGKSPPTMTTQIKELVDAYMHRRMEAANDRDGTVLAIDHFTLYDIRTTVISRLEEKPFFTPDKVLDAILLHRKEGRRSTKIYARAKLGNEAGEVLQAWNDHLDELMARSDAWPGGRVSGKMKPKERMARIDDLRAEWPMRADQARAKEYLEEHGIDTAEFRRRQRRKRAAAKKNA